MSESVVFWTWAIVAAVGLVTVHGYASYREMVRASGENWNADLRFLGTIVAVSWPFSFCLFAVVGAYGLVFYWGPRFVFEEMLARRKAIVDAELAEKQAADEAHHEIERGAHR